jgi:diacylglycerol kinase
MRPRPMAEKTVHVRGVARSFRFAWRGLVALLRSQPNARVHAAATLAVLVLGLLLRLAPIEWCAILIAAAVVWIAEALNTSVELLADAVAPSMHPLVERSKNVAAAAVLVASIAAVGVALLIFMPRLWALTAGAAGAS